MAGSKVSADRQILVAAQEKGGLFVPLAFLRLSGPGWLQSAITLGGGSLASALYLGCLGGTAMLWLNLVAIIVGVIMLSAISYVVLSSGKRPYEAINEYVNPVLGVGWITATILANIIWCMPQFSLCYDVIDKNLFPGELQDADSYKLGMSAVLLIPAAILVWLSLLGGIAGRIFDFLLKLLVGMVVVCFVAVVVKLTMQSELDWTGQILPGLIPDFSQWWNPTATISSLIAAAPEGVQSYWTSELIKSQRAVMISTTATVVGINMTFLLPYSMLNRGWDKPFRGLARFDLITGMAIPFVLVTGCIIIASAYSFHGKADKSFLSDDPAVVQQSKFFQGASKNLAGRMRLEKNNPLAEIDAMADGKEKNAAMTAAIADYTSKLSQEERKLSVTLVKPNAEQLALSLKPLLGEEWANRVFGIGVLGMGFSTIIILMMINGYAFGELFNMPSSIVVKMIGAVLAGIVGFLWPLIWESDSKTWLVIMASTFGAILLPIAYVSFFALMNNERLLKEDLPRGGSRVIWNCLMVFGVIAALAQAGSSLYTKLFDASGNLIALNEGSLILGGIIAFALVALMGFSAAKK
ncbi:MAG: divalent metal cation transporter [Planctomycetota bacterium]|nr:divalent metal cation transporter [Planctomycetota bacterium]